MLVNIAKQVSPEVQERGDESDMAQTSSDRSAAGVGKGHKGEGGAAAQPAPRAILAQTCQRSAIAARETQRRIKHGPIRPMVEPSFWERLFRSG